MALSKQFMEKGPYPVPTSFILSYYQGYYANSKVRLPGDNSVAWGGRYKDLGQMVATGEDIENFDFEMFWNHFG